MDMLNVSWRRRLIKENLEREVSLSIADEYYYMMVSLTDELRSLQAHLLHMIRFDKSIIFISLWLMLKQRLDGELNHICWSIVNLRGAGITFYKQI